MAAEKHWIYSIVAGGVTSPRALGDGGNSSWCVTLNAIAKKGMGGVLYLVNRTKIYTHSCNVSFCILVDNLGYLHYPLPSYLVGQGFSQALLVRPA